MRTVLHLSDLHFGRVDPALPGPLAEFAHRLRPDCVVVSGDLTQRARPEQFEAARRFLDMLPTPQVVVPGNHDVPLWNLWKRFTKPLAGWRAYIGADVEPDFLDEEIAVFGVNSARSLTFKDGRVNARQLHELAERARGLAPHVLKVVVSHHPFDLRAGVDDDLRVGRAGLALRTFADVGVDVLLSGHLHVSHAGHTAERVGLGNWSALLVQAGTATSTRGRGEANSFNVLRVGSRTLSVRRHAWNPVAARFVCVASERFPRRGPKTIRPR